MELKNYNKIKLVLVVLIAMISSQAIILKIYILPIGAVLFSALLLLYLRSRVKEVVADERDYISAGKAAMMSIQIYAWIAVAAMFVFYANRDFNPAYEVIGLTLAYSTCILMFLYALIFRYYNQMKFSDKKLIYLAMVFIFIMIMAVVSLRIFSGEDDWLCQNGEWVKHGQPDFPAPTATCEK